MRVLLVVAIALFVVALVCAMVPTQVFQNGAVAWTIAGLLVWAVDTLLVWRVPIRGRELP